MLLVFCTNILLLQSLISVSLVVVVVVVVVAGGQSGTTLTSRIETVRDAEISNHRFMEAVAGSLHKRGDLELSAERFASNELHTVLFAIKQQNLDYLYEMLRNVSDPSSPQYRTYLSRQVGDAIILSKYLYV